MEYAVIVTFNDLEKIETLRKKYDPLHGLIAPHLTLVFPFETDAPADIIRMDIAAAVTNIEPFMIELRDITAADDYLFLNVKKGNDALIALHDQLYLHLHAAQLDRHYTYLPHVTVGRCASPVDLSAALAETADLTESFPVLVNEIVLEQIAIDGKSLPAGSFQLKKKR